MSAQNDSSFLRMFLLVLGALVAFTLVIIFAANLIGGGMEDKQAGDSRRQAAIAERIAPVGKVAVAKAGAKAAAPRSGKDMVAASCGACHATGALNAPKIGSAEAWQPRLDAAGGLDGLLKTAIAGKGAMPPRGGSDASDQELRNAIEYMLKESGIEAGAATAAAKPAAAAPAAEPAPANPVAAAAGAVSAMAQQAGQQVAQAAQQVQAAASQAVQQVTGAAPAAAPAAAADESALAQAKNCLGCHQVAVKVVGPAYKDVAAKYKGDPGALEHLVKKVKSGSMGAWGQIPMPPNNVTDEEATRLVKWILSLN